jgi:hypothetical protein
MEQWPLVNYTEGNTPQHGGRHAALAQQAQSQRLQAERLLAASRNSERRAEAEHKPHLLLTPATDLPRRLGTTSHKKPVQPVETINKVDSVLAQRVFRFENIHQQGGTTRHHALTAHDPLLHYACIIMMQEVFDITSTELIILIDEHTIKVWIDPVSTGKIFQHVPQRVRALTQGTLLRGNMYVVEPIHIPMPRSITTILHATQPSWLFDDENPDLSEGQLQLALWPFRDRAQHGPRH